MSEEIAQAAGDRDYLGRIVRDAWVAWAREQPNPKPQHLDPWEALPEPIKEVDRRIGAAARAAVCHDLSNAVQAERDRAIAAEADAAALREELKLLRELRDDVARWRASGGDARELAYVLETSDRAAQTAQTEKQP